MPYYPKYKASYNKVFRNRSLQQFIHSYKFVTFAFQIFYQVIQPVVKLIGTVGMCSDVNQ